MGRHRGLCRARTSKKGRENGCAPCGKCHPPVKNGEYRGKEQQAAALTRLGEAMPHVGATLDGAHRLALLPMDSEASRGGQRWGLPWPSPQMHLACLAPTNGLVTLFFTRPLLSRDPDRRLQRPVWRAVCFRPRSPTLTSEMESTLGYMHGQDHK